jgi:hypothetical protein
MIYIYEGDEVELCGVKHEVVDGALVAFDERTPLERRLDEIEDRLEKLENPGDFTITWPTDNAPAPTNPWPCDPYQPYPYTPNPYVPGTTWVSSDEAS